VPRWRPRLRRPGRRQVIAGLLLAATVAAVIPGVLRLHVNAGTDSFVPPNDPGAQALSRVGSAFGGDPIVVLLESDRPRGLLATAGLAKLLDLEGRLARSPDVAAVYGPATVLNQVAGRSQDLLAELTGYRDGLRSAAEQKATDAGAGAAAAQATGRAAVDDFDRRYGALLVQGLPAGLPTLRNDRFVSTVVFNAAGDPRPQWRFVVPNPNSVAVLVRPRQDLDQSGLERLVDTVRTEVGRTDLGAKRITVSGVPAVAAALGDRVRTEVPLLGAIALVAVGTWFVLVRWAGRRHRLLPLAATAIGTSLTLAGYGWAGHPLSLGAIAFLPVLIGVGSDFMTYLTRGAPRRLVVTVGLATAVSFGALAASPIPTVRDLGVTLAIGICLSLAAGVILARWQGEQLTAEPVEQPASAPGPGASRRVRLAAAAGVGLLALAGWLVLPQLSLRADLQGFAGGLPVLEDAQHVEDVLGSSGEFTIALSGGGTATPEAMRWMTAAQQAVIRAEGDKLRPVVSPPTLLGFLGTDPTAEQVAAALRLLPPYLTGSVINADRSLAVLTFGTRLSDAEQLRDLRDAVLAALPPPPSGMHVELTGLPMLAVSAYEDVSAERSLANLLGIAAAGVVLAAGLRRRSDALLAVASAGLATGLGLLALRVTGTGLTPVTVALGSLTAAVGCEFAVLLAEATRRGDRGLSRAVLLAAAASATGYAVLMVSELTVVVQFGLLFTLSVVLAFGSAAFVVWAARIAPRVPPLNKRTPDAELVGVH
jgi:predicted RND superfamily exporter protein